MKDETRYEVQRMISDRLYSLEESQEATISAIEILADRVNGFLDRLEEPDVLKRLAAKHKANGLHGTVVTAEMFGQIVTRLIAVEEFLNMDDTDA